MQAATGPAVTTWLTSTISVRWPVPRQAAARLSAPIVSCIVSPLVHGGGERRSGGSGGHRPDADLRAAAPAGGPGGLRHALQPPSAAPGQEPAATRQR